MKREDIIRMAREAGLVSNYSRYDDWIDAGPSGEDLMAFAQLVAAAEREACAKLLEDWDKLNWNIWDCAESIRARGNP